MEQPQLRRGAGSVRHRGLRHQPPGALQEPVHPLHPLGAPWLGRFERSHEHLIEPHAVGAVVADHIVRIDHVAQRLGHLGRELGQGFVVGTADRAVRRELHLIGRHQHATAVLVARSEDHPLVDQLEERLLRGNQPEIKEHLVPEPGVEQMEHRVFRAADVEIDRHPVAFLRRIPRGIRIFRVDVAQIVPAGASPLRHRVGFAAAAAAGDRIHVVDPVFRLRQRRLPGSGGFEVRHLRQIHRQFGIVDQFDRTILVVDDRERFAPVALAAEKPVAQLVFDRLAAEAARGEPLRRSGLGFLH